MADQDTEYIRYKCSDCGWIFSEDSEVLEPECPECYSNDVTAIERTRY